MGDIAWTMNCILFGAEIIELVKQGKKEEALAKIKGLTSEIDDTTADYIFMRLSEL